MNIELFGWLTKPHILMTGLDTLMMLGEMLITVGIGVVFAYYIECKNRKRMRR